MRESGFRLIESFELPWYVYVGNKKFSINLNQYRNAHYQVLNQPKRAFEQEIKPPTVKNLPEIWVKYIVHRKGKARIDTMNIVSVADKFFLDFLVLWGVIKDDHSEIAHHLAPEVIRNNTKNYIEAIVYTENSK